MLEEYGEIETVVDGLVAARQQAGDVQGYEWQAEKDQRDKAHEAEEQGCGSIAALWRA